MLTRHVAKVLYFLKVQHASEAVSALRLAVCLVYKPMAPKGRAICARAGSVLYQSYALDVATLDCKLVCASLEGMDKGLMYFMPSASMTLR